VTRTGKKAPGVVGRTGRIREQAGSDAVPEGLALKGREKEAD
jgi:hypothetical protein